ncbi:hypothetical protein DPV78_006706 [Talaromyces pinophilus]|nr:hypothetical protein DPV78_006706 [Talaromyces pinophilus]
MSQASGFGPPKNQQDETPLHLAWKDRKWDLVRTLLDSRGDPWIPDSKGNTILHLARCLREQQCVTNLYTGSRGQLQDINNRVRKGFSQLLDQGVGINTRNDNSGTPTFANVPSLACIQSLSSPKSGTLSRDFLAQCMRTQQLAVDINTRNDNGQTPIFKYVRGLACTQSLRSPITDTLVATGADVLVRNNEGESLLHMIAKLPCNSSYRQCQGKEKFTVSFASLMEIGLDPFQEDTKQRTPVNVAAAYGREGILALFNK